MTTAQESTNGHSALPPPCSFPDLQDHDRNKALTDDSNPDSLPASPIRERETFPANAYHVPPKRYAPKANSYQYDDFLAGDKDTTPLPNRCQFMFSDGRQCTMARSDIHPSLCRYHSEREEQLFGDPGQSFVAAKLDLPELYSACRDLTTAAGVSRALAQVFRLLAHRRISRQEAATFAKLGQLLLQSISAARAEFVAAPDVQIAQRVEQPINRVVERQKGVSSRESLAANVYPPAGESLPAANVYQQDELRGTTQSHQELSPVHKVELRSVNKDHQELSPVNKIFPSESAVADARGTSPLPSPVNNGERDRDRSVNERPLSASSRAAKPVKQATPVGVDRDVSYVSHNQHLHGQHLQIPQNEQLQNSKSSSLAK